MKDEDADEDADEDERCRCSRSPAASTLRGARHQWDGASQAPAEGLLDVLEGDRRSKVLDGRADPISDGLQQVGVEAPQVDGVAAEDAPQIALGHPAEDVPQRLAVN